MLSELLEKKSKIGTKGSIAYIASWLSKCVSNLEDLNKCIQGRSDIRVSEVTTVIGLFEKMSLLSFVDDNCFQCPDILKFKDAEESEFICWFTQAYVKFIIDNGIINLDNISFSISRNKYIIAKSAISTKNACYRNLLLELNVIRCLSDGSYEIISLIDRAIEDYSRTKKKSTSEVELLENLEKQRELGAKGEEFVLNFEKKRITNPILQNTINRISIIDVSAGFDIVSYNNDGSTKFDRFIEVKTYVGNPHFYWSKNEIEKARLMGDAYYIYLVNGGKIDQPGYKPQCISNPIKNIIQTTEWMKTSQSFLVELLYTHGNDKTPQVSLKLEDNDCSQQELNRYCENVNILQQIINTSIMLGETAMQQLEIILSRINDNNNGIYKQSLSLLREAINANHTKSGLTVGTLNNFGTVNDLSGSKINIDKEDILNS